MNRLGAVKERLWAGAESGYRRRILASLPVDPSARLLDVGCEDGVWTDAVRSRLGISPSQVVGLEIAPGLAERARQHGFGVHVADLDATWPLEDSGFDVVHANQVIEHVRLLDHFLSELRRVLAPGGLAIVCTENLASWHNIAALLFGFQPFSLTNISRIRPVGNPFAVDDGYLADGESFQHVYVMTLTALRDVVASHGLAVEDSWGFGYHPLPSFLARSFAKLDPRHAHFIGVVARKLPSAPHLQSAQ